MECRCKSPVATLGSKCGRCKKEIKRSRVISAPVHVRQVKKAKQTPE